MRRVHAMAGATASYLNGPAHEGVSTSEQTDGEGAHHPPVDLRAVAPGGTPSLDGDELLDVRGQRAGGAVGEGHRVILDDMGLQIGVGRVPLQLTRLNGHPAGEPDR